MAPAPSPRIRAATSKDVHIIARLLIAALDKDPLFNFNFPYRIEYPEDCFEAWKRMLHPWLYEPWVAFLVAEMEIEEGGEKRWEIVAFARWIIQPDLVVWDVEQTVLMNGNGWLEWAWRWIPYLRSQIPAFQQQPQLRHANKAHLSTFRNTVASTDKHYWDCTIGKFPRNVRVTALATHPEYRRRGAAKALVEWGLKWVEASRAKMEGMGWEDVVVGVEATKEGRCLYRSLGFEDVGVEELRDEKGEVRVRTWIMVRGA